ncbi:HNH endonuclease [Halorarius halobius]|uniref:HNH endonuclease n=1 Tax=Halorarius halobius TaxID=2962671 RepID=UPI0020CF9101|nr:HNH endonuclease [Halorarius halobius]
MTDAPTLQHTGGGYEYVRCRASGDDATVYIHRLLFVAEYGFDSLPPGWHVHHERSIPWLNTPDNLTAISPDDHAEIHISSEP